MIELIKLFSPPLITDKVFFHQNAIAAFKTLANGYYFSKIVAVPLFRFFRHHHIPHKSRLNMRGLLAYL